MPSGIYLRPCLSVFQSLVIRFIQVTAYTFTFGFLHPISAILNVTFIISIIIDFFIWLCVYSHRYDHPTVWQDLTLVFSQETDQIRTERRRRNGGDDLKRGNFLYLYITVEMLPLIFIILWIYLDDQTGVSCSTGGSIACKQNVLKHFISIQRMYLCLCCRLRLFPRVFFMRLRSSPDQVPRGLNRYKLITKKNNLNFYFSYQGCNEDDQ